MTAKVMPCMLCGRMRYALSPHGWCEDCESQFQKVLEQRKARKALSMKEFYEAVDMDKDEG